MPRLKAFRGIRYSSSDRLKDLVCPPYDVISPEEQAALYARHANNAIRLELAAGSHASGPEQYREVGETVARWLAEGVLGRDENPSLYVYRQDFIAPADGSRRCRVAGVIGALELEPFGGGVLPHERTMAGPKADRLALMRATAMNFSPIYGIYRGGGGLAPYYASLEHRPPAVRFADADGILHRLWMVDSPAEIEILSSALVPGPLVIADGHHRYETALAYGKEQELGTGHDAIMCFCVDADSEDLVVLPYNRALRTPGDARTALGAFPLRDLDGDPAAALAASAADHPFVLVFPEGSALLEVSDADVVARLGERSPAWRALDVVALHEVVLPQAFPDGVADITFSRDPDEVMRLVGEEGWTCGILLRPLEAPQIVEVARSGERMPQKASYFWPKALTGLVFRSLR